jgi:hypothetical protein
MSESIKKIGIPLAATMVIVLALAVVASSLATPASAQLQCSPDQNPAGNSPPGQQTCTCPPLTQCTENVNPAGNTPPGKNK